MTNKNNIKVIKQSNSGITLVCFPFVGANWSAFIPAAKNIEEDIQVLAINPPGHPGDSSPALESVEEMAALYLEQLEPYFDQQLVFWGYSLGGLVVHSMLNTLEEKGVKLDLSVIISASVPPRYITDSKRISGLTNDQIIEFFHSIGGIPDALLREREFLNLFLPVIKSDYKAFEDYRPAGIHKLDYPCFVLYGKQDNFISRQKIQGWEDYFVSTPVFYGINGSHLFIKDNLPGCVEVLQQVLRTIVVNAY